MSKADDSRLALLFGSSQDARNFSSLLAKNLDLIVEAYSDQGAFLAALLARGPREVICEISDVAGFQKLQDVLLNAVGPYSEKIRPEHVHLLFPKESDEMKAVLESPLLNNVVYRNSWNPEKIGKAYSRSLRLLANDSMVDLGASCDEHYREELTTSDQRKETLSRIESFFDAAGVASKAIQVISSAADELLMNGIFDAPKDDLSVQIYRETSRSASLLLKGERKVECIAAIDDGWASVFVRDYCGTLNCSDVFQHIFSNHPERGYSVNERLPGAGLGLARIFRSGGSLGFRSIRGRFTTAMAAYPRIDNVRELKREGQFIVYSSS